MKSAIITLYVFVFLIGVAVISLIVKEQDDENRFKALGEALYVGMTKKQFEDQNYYDATYYVLQYQNYFNQK
jgi:hypothetical protein